MNLKQPSAHARERESQRARRGTNIVPAIHVIHRRAAVDYALRDSAGMRASTRKRKDRKPGNRRQINRLGSGHSVGFAASETRSGKGGSSIGGSTRAVAAKRRTGQETGPMIERVSSRIQSGGEAGSSRPISGQTRSRVAAPSILDDQTAKPGAHADPGGARRRNQAGPGDCPCTRAIATAAEVRRQGGGSDAAPHLRFARCFEGRCFGEALRPAPVAHARGSLPFRPLPRAACRRWSGRVDCARLAFFRAPR